MRVAAPPDAVFERLSHVDALPSFLADIKRLTVIQHEGRRWHVRIATQTMDCGEHDYAISLQSNRTVKLVIDATGIDAWGSIRIEPHKEGGSTAKFNLFIQTTGVIGWFIPESTVRARQEQMVRRDLKDLAKAYSSK